MPLSKAERLAENAPAERGWRQGVNGGAAVLCRLILQAKVAPGMGAPAALRLL